MGTLCKEAVREGRELLHTRLRGNRCNTSDGLLSGTWYHRWHGAARTTVVPAQAPDPESLFLPLQSSPWSRRPAPLQTPLTVPLLTSRSSPCASQSLLLPTTCCLRQYALVIKQSSWVRVINKCHSSKGG